MKTLTIAVILLVTVGCQIQERGQAQVQTQPDMEVSVSTVQSLVSIEISPIDYCERLLANIAPRHNGKVTGETFCWHAASGAGQFVTGYQATGNTAWLAAGKIYFDHLLALMAEAPDGYKGWIGAYGYDTEYICDVHVGDAILFNQMLSYAEVVLADQQLLGEYVEAANFYVQMAEKHFVEKWDSRGTWVEDGEYGVYVSWTKYMLANDLSEWRTVETAAGSGLSLPFNKQITSTMVSLRLYRITGKQKYWDIARRANLLMKRRFQYFEDHYSWNYWEPLGPWDVTEDEKDLRHWVNTHPYRNYQSGEVADIVEAYHSGLVFDELDIYRILMTNLTVMWNGNLHMPRYRNSNSIGPWRGVDKSVPEGKRGWAGTLWSLGDFNATIRNLYANRLRPGSVGYAYYHNVTAKVPVSFDRQLLGGWQADVGVTGYTRCRDLTMAAVLPSRIKVGDKGYIVSKARQAGELDVELWSAGGRKISTLYSGRTEGGSDGHAGIVVVPWDGTVDGHELNGKYMVRWVSEGGTREYKIEVFK